MPRFNSVTASLGISAFAAVVAVAPVALLVLYADSLTAAPAVSNTAVLGGTNDLPFKWAASNLLPQYFQESRGTCWSFATIGWLESMYRQNGIAKGFLKPEQYVRLSNQAFDISVIDACRPHPDVCDALGEGPWANKTSGGETWWLYSLSKLYTEVLPESVCPYSPGEDHELECPGMDEALRTNPIKFDIRNMETVYNPREIKSLMVARNRPLIWTSNMHTVFYYMPCNDAYWAEQDVCSEAQRVRCPSDRFYHSEWCARTESAMYNQDGEFFMKGNTLLEGGHAMVVVGFNDEFVTKQGNKGGFILKNSWHDFTYGTGPVGQGARGSHSVAYWMQQISAWDEKALCPGPLNPDNWLSCVSQSAGPTMARNIVKPKPAVVNVADEKKDISKTCLSDNFMQYLVNNTLQPTEFVCRDSKWCSTDSRFRYFLLSTERTIEQDMLKVCMMQYDTTSTEQKTICTPYINPSVIAYIWAPVQWQQDKLKNDLDFCGYYFWPYDLSYKQGGLWASGSNYAVNYDIVWDDMSYLANSAKYPKRDYSLIKSSTGTQKTANFGGMPSPWPKKRY